MNNWLAHDRTMDELPEFLSNQILQLGENNNKRIVIIWRDQTASSRDVDVSSLSSTYAEEGARKDRIKSNVFSKQGIKTTYSHSLLW